MDIIGRFLEARAKKKKEREIENEKWKGIQVTGAGVLHKPSEEYLKSEKAMEHLRKFSKYWKENQDENGHLALR